MSVAVIGAGIYGLTTAIELDRSGFDVDLFEKEGDIMTAASWGNQWRLHRGYHYPRSASTARSCRQSAELFQKEFPEAVIKSSDHYYCIASENTKTSPDEYVSFCENMNLEYEFVEPDVVNQEKIDIAIKANENRIDPHALKSRFESDISKSDVNLHLNKEIKNVNELSHDYIVIATYSNINRLLQNERSLRGRYKFELVEKPLVELPPLFQDTSLVVMDGPFMCFDPYGNTDDFLLGNVVHATHDKVVGVRPDFDEKYDEVLNNGIIEPNTLSKFEDFIRHGSEFIPELSRADHIGSFYTVRTVLADVEDTDKRPTLVERDGNIFKLFSGKIASCVPAAQTIASELKKEPTL